MGVFAEAMRKVYGAVLCGMIVLAACGAFAILADWITGEFKN